MGRTDTAAIAIDAASRQVYAALIDPVARAEWLPPTGMTGRIDRWDPRPGGGYRMVLTYDDASAAPGKSTADADVVEARFVAIDDGVRIVEAIDFESDDPMFGGTMTMSWTLDGDDTATTVTITAENVPDGIRADDHDTGMRASLEQLAHYVRGPRTR